MKSLDSLASTVFYQKPCCSHSCSLASPLKKIWDVWVGAYVALKAVNKFQYWLISRFHSLWCTPYSQRFRCLSWLLITSQMVPLLFSLEDLAAMFSTQSILNELCPREDRRVSGSCLYVASSLHGALNLNLLMIQFHVQSHLNDFSSFSAHRGEEFLSTCCHVSRASESCEHDCRLVLWVSCLHTEHVFSQVTHESEKRAWSSSAFSSCSEGFLSSQWI